MTIFAYELGTHSNQQFPSVKQLLDSSRQPLSQYLFLIGVIQNIQDVDFTQTPNHRSHTPLLAASSLVPTPRC